MDSSITAAGRALGAGDPLGALKRVALRDDPAALALRGIAMAQLGDLGRARKLLRRAARGFGPREVVARARCLTAQAEVALAARDLAWPPRALDEALRTLTAHGDRENAAHARLLLSRHLLLLGRVDEADGTLATLELDAAPSRLVAIARLVGSPTMARSALNLFFARNREPLWPCSSSTKPTKTTSDSRGRAPDFARSQSAMNRHATDPLVSQAPRPYIRPPLVRGVNCCSLATFTVSRCGASNMR
jgi:hypothetical protein